MQVKMIRLAIALSFIVMAQASSIHKEVQPNAIINGSSSASSPWLNKVANWDPRARPSGCLNRPWMCRQGEAPGTQMRCCRNRCVDVSSDVNNCGLCGNRCRFSWQCCRGFCTKTNSSPFDCGRCGNRCPRGVRCTYGMCGYGQPGPRQRLLQQPPQPQPQPPCPPKPPRSYPQGGPHPPRCDKPPPIP